MHTQWCKSGKAVYIQYCVSTDCYKRQDHLCSVKLSLDPKGHHSNPCIFSITETQDSYTKLSSYAKLWNGVGGEQRVEKYKQELRLTWNYGLKSVVTNSLSKHYVSLQGSIINKVKLRIAWEVNVFVKFCMYSHLSLKKLKCIQKHTVNFSSSTNPLMYNSRPSLL